MPVEVVGSEPGDAAGLKLVRSVFMKGLAASVLESVEAAKRRGAEPWLRGEIADVIGEPLLERLVSGTVTHAARRLDEMEAAAAYLEELGVEPRISRAAAEWLEALADEADAPGLTPGRSNPPTLVSARPARRASLPPRTTSARPPRTARG